MCLCGFPLVRSLTVIDTIPVDCHPENRQRKIDQEGAMLVWVGRQKPNRRSMFLVSWVWLCVAWVNPGTVVAQANPSECPPTRADIEGPFYEPNAPLRTQTGQG